MATLRSAKYFVRLIFTVYNAAAKPPKTYVPQTFDAVTHVQC